MRIIITTILLVATMTVHAEGETYLMANFDRGIPNNFTLVCADGMSINTSAFKSAMPTKEWYATAVNGTDGKAAVSASQRTSATVPTDNWLITPKMHISSAAAWLRWNARSINYSLRDGYQVMVKEGDDGTFTELYAVEEETYAWATHAVPLAPYVGKDIYIGIRHNSTNRYLLAVDNLFVGVPSEVSLVADNTSRHFVSSNDTTSITGTITNVGREVHLAKLVVTASVETYANTASSSQIDTTYTMPLDIVLAVGEKHPFTLDIPMEAGQFVKYTIEAYDADGNSYALFSDAMACSRYPRHLLVEKFTGLWCNNCPAADPMLFSIAERFGSEVSIVDVHGYHDYLDPFSQDAYASALGINSYPTVLYNRDSEIKQIGYWTMTAYVEAAMKKPATAMISATAQHLDDGKLKMLSTVQFASDTDNSLGRYRVGYILKERHVEGDKAVYTNDGTSVVIQQTNNCTQLSNEEYYFLPTRIPASIMTYHDVARGGETAESLAALGSESGIRGSLPATLEAGADYTVETTIDMPSTIANASELSVVAVLFRSGSVENVAEADVTDSSAGVTDINADRHSALDTPYYDLCGRMTTNPAKGVYIHNGKKLLK